MPLDQDLQDLYAEGRRRGIFKRDPELAAMAQEGVKRGLLRDLSGGSVYPRTDDSSAPPSSASPSNQGVKAAPGFRFREAMGAAAPAGQSYDPATQAAIAQAGNAFAQSPQNTRRAPMAQNDYRPPVAPTVNPLTQTKRGKALAGAMKTGINAISETMIPPLIPALGMGAYEETQNPVAPSPTFLNYLRSNPGASGVFARAANQGTLPARGGLVGAGAGAEAISPLAAMVGNPLGKVAIEATGAAIGAAGGSGVVSSAQDAILRALVPNAYASLQAQRTIDAQTHPDAARLGSLAPMLATMSLNPTTPGVINSLKKMARPATGVPRLMATGETVGLMQAAKLLGKDALVRLMGAAIPTAINTGIGMSQGQPFNAKNTLEDMVLFSLFPNMNKKGHALVKAGRVAGAVATRPRSASEAYQDARFRMQQQQAGLNFMNRDEAGNLIPNPNDLIANPYESTANPTATAAPLAKRPAQTQPDQTSSVAPAETTPTVVVPTSTTHVNLTPDDLAKAMSWWDAMPAEERRQVLQQGANYAQSNGQLNASGVAKLGSDFTTLGPVAQRFVAKQHAGESAVIPHTESLTSTVTQEIAPVPDPVQREDPSTLLGRDYLDADFITGKKLHEMSLDEIQKSLEFEKNRSRNIEDSILGDQAGAWRRAWNLSNSMDSRKAGEGAVKVKEIESRLKPEDVDALYGVGQKGLDPDHLKGVAQQYRLLHDSGNATQLGQALGRDLYALKGQTDPEKASDPYRAKLALGKVAEATRVAQAKGFDFGDVLEGALESATAHASNVKDYTEALHPYIEDLILARDPEAKVTPGLVQNTAQNLFGSYGAKRSAIVNGSGTAPSRDVVPAIQGNKGTVTARPEALSKGADKESVTTSDITPPATSQEELTQAPESKSADPEEIPEALRAEAGSTYLGKNANGDDVHLEHSSARRVIYDADGNVVAAEGLKYRGKPEAERPERYRIVTHASEMAHPSETSPAIQGHEGTVYTPDNDPVSFKWGVLDASQIIPSHDTNFKPRGDYDQPLQPRDRSRAATQEQVAELAARLNPERLTDSASTAEGAPLVGADNMVESGNGRTMGILRGYEANTPAAQAYRKHVLDNAGRYGLDPEQVKAIRQPILVRVRQGSLSAQDRAALAERMGASPVAAMSPTEKALIDARRLISSGALASYVPNEAGNLNTAPNDAFRTRFLGSLPTSERAEMYKPNGELSPDGEIRLTRALMAAAYGDANLLTRLMEGGEEGTLNLGKALKSAAGKIAMLKQAVESGQVGPLDISEDIADAANDFITVSRRKGIDTREAVRSHLAQIGMFGDDLSPVAQEIMAFFGEYNSSAKKMGGLLSAYADAAMATKGAAGALMDGDRKTSAMDLIDLARQKVAGEAKREQPELFDQSESDTARPGGQAKEASKEPGTNAAELQPKRKTRPAAKTAPPVVANGSGASAGVDPEPPAPGLRKDGKDDAESRVNNPPANNEPPATPEDSPRDDRPILTHIGLTDRPKMAAALADAFQLEAGIADDLAATIDSFSHGLGKKLGMPAEEVYRRYVAGVTRGDAQMAKDLGGDGTEHGATYPTRTQAPRPDDVRNVVAFLTGSGVDTPIHEIGHMSLNMLGAAAQHNPAVMADMQAIQKWAMGDPNVPIDETGHEKFAGAFERFMTQGVAPNNSLKSAFQRVREVAAEIYARLSKQGKLPNTFNLDVMRKLGAYFEEVPNDPNRDRHAGNSPVVPPPNDGGGVGASQPEHTNRAAEDVAADGSSTQNAREPANPPGSTPADSGAGSGDAGDATHNEALARTPMAEQSKSDLESPALSKPSRSTPSPEKPSPLHLPSTAELPDSFEAPIAPASARIRVAPIKWDGKSLVDTFTLIDRLAMATDRAIFRQKQRAGVLGHYRPADARVTIRWHGDVETTAHEIGHALDDDFNLVGAYSQARQRSPWDAELFQQTFQATSTTSMTLAHRRAEAVAEWIRAYTMNPTEAIALAPTFAAHFQASVPKNVTNALAQFGMGVRRLAGAPAHEQIATHIQWGEGDQRSIREKLEEALTNGSDDPSVFALSWKDNLATQLQDSMRPVVRATQWAQDLTGARHILPENDPILLMRLHADTVGKVGQMLDSGFVNTRNEPVLDPTTGKPIGGLNWMLEPILRTSKSETERLMRLAAVQGIAERTLEKGQQLGRDEVLTGIGMGLWKDTDSARVAISEIQQMPKAARDALTETLRRYRLVANAMLDYMADSGRISPADAQTIKDSNKQYISLQRVMEDAPLFEGSGAGRKMSASVADPLKGYKGSTRKLRDPFVSLLDQAYKIVEESDRNRAMNAFIDMFRSNRGMYEGSPVPLSQVAAQVSEASEGKTIKVFHNGEAQHWQINDPDVLKALKGLGQPGSPQGLMKMVAYLAARMPRNLITGNPAFAIRNFTRDMPERWLKSEFNSLPWDSFKKFAQDEKERYALSGGLGSGYYGGSRQQYGKAITHIVNEASKSGGRRLIRLPDQPLESYRKLLERAEIQGRMAEYSAAYRFAQDKLGYDEYNAALYAAGKARGLMDFAVAGNLLRSISPYIPFINANVQGFAANWRAVKSDPRRFATKFLLFAMVKALPRILIGMLGAKLGKDKLEEYRALPAYQRDLCINLPLPWADGWLSIPVGFEAASAATAIERTLDYNSGNKDAFIGYFTQADAPDDQNFLMKVMMGALAQEILPLKPESLMGLGGAPGSISEIRSNYDTFRQRNIVPERETKLALKDRRMASSASRAGKLFGAILSSDPRVVDFFLQNVGGGTGTILTTLSDAGRQDKPVSATKALGMATGIFKEGPSYGAPQVQRAMAGMDRAGVTQPPEQFRSAQEKLRAAKTPQESEDAKRELRLAAQHPDVQKAIQEGETKQRVLSLAVEIAEQKAGKPLTYAEQNEVRKELTSAPAKRSLVSVSKGSVRLNLKNAGKPTGIRGANLSQLETKESNLLNVLKKNRK